MVWFGFAALAQLSLTDFERAWSAGFAEQVFGGGLLLAGMAVLAAGLAPVRGTISIDWESYSSRRALAAAAGLLAAGAAGLAVIATELGGIPVLASDVDTARIQAIGLYGEPAIPGWTVILTSGFQLSLWLCALAVRLDRDGEVWVKIAAGGLAVAAFAGIAAGGSRHPVIFALFVPAVAMYLLARPSPARARLLLAFALGVLVLALGGLFLVRSDDAGDVRETGEVEVGGYAAPLRPLVPIYVSGAYPLEEARRVAERVPGGAARGNGRFLLAGLPDRAFPEGKPDYFELLRQFSRTSLEEPFWFVATYQARAYLDFGLPGVLIWSLVVGALLGLAYRLARGGRSLFAVAVVGYAAYFAAVSTYESPFTDPRAAIELLAILALERVIRAAGPAPADARGR